MTTPTFVTEIPLQVTPAQETILNKRFEAARQVYNACLGEALRRLDLMRQGKAWAAARQMPQGKAKSDAFRSLNEAFGFRKYDLHAWAVQFGHSWLGYHLDSQTIKQLASRAFTWVEQSLFDRGRGRPRFKRYNSLNAVESINNLQGIIWREERVIWSPGRGGGEKLILAAIINLNDPVTRHGLECRVKYVRMVRRELNGKIRFFAQLVNEGAPYQRFQKGTGTIGLKVGASTVAVVTTTRAKLVLLCEELEANTLVEKRLQRQIDRQRRANNPNNYNLDGTIKPRSQLKRWIKSNRQLENEKKLREIRRKQSAYRKSLHGQLINEIVRMGDRVNLERISYKAWQKEYGRVINVRGPGMFAARLKQKMTEAGGEVIEFSPLDEKLSQLDHQTGQYQKKTMGQRWHIFTDGTKVQRNLYAAFLAMCLEDGTFNQALADERWPAAREVIETALADAKQKDKRPSTFGF